MIEIASSLVRGPIKAFNKVALSVASGTQVIAPAIAGKTVVVLGGVMVAQGVISSGVTMLDGETTFTGVLTLSAGIQVNLGEIPMAVNSAFSIANSTATPLRGWVIYTYV